MQSNQNELNLLPILLNQQKTEANQNKDEINYLKDKYLINSMFKGIKETNGNGIKGFSRFNFNETDKNEYNDEMEFFQNNNIFDLKNNPDLQKIINNNYIPSYINIKGINGYNGNSNSNFIFENNNNNPLINLQNDLNNNINSFNNNKKIDNITNYNNVNNTNNINNVIFNNNFNNFNISNLDKSKLTQLISEINNNSTNIHNLNIQEINDIPDFNDDGISNEDFKNCKNINIYNTINNINYDFRGEFQSDENENHHMHNDKNNRKKNNKKKNGYVKNCSHKEKEIKDFKKFCDGIRCPLHEYICSQVGSRIMQKYLNLFPHFIITNLIEKINIYFEKIMCNTYGNYFCQRLYTISSIEQRRIILNSMKDIFINVSENPAGAHVIQTIIEVCYTKEEKDIIMEYIKSYEMQLALHPEGTHVLQKIIQIFAEDERQNLTDVLCTYVNVFNLCQDLKGISVIKRLISFNKEKTNMVKLVESFYPNLLQISRSSSGSYILQYLIEQWGIDVGLKLIHFCILNFEAFAINKHSANLINKILLICLKRNSIIRSIFSDNLMNCNELIIINAVKEILFEPNKIINVYKNKYGQALVLKIRKLLNNEEIKKLFLLIKSFENSPNYMESKKYRIYIQIFEYK